jgi:hypothetical protein
VAAAPLAADLGRIAALGGNHERLRDRLAREVRERSEDQVGVLGRPVVEIGVGGLLVETASTLPAEQVTIPAPLFVGGPNPATDNARTGPDPKPTRLR